MKYKNRTKEHLINESAENRLRSAQKKSGDKNCQMGRTYEHFFNLSNDMFCIAGEDGYFKLVNPAFEKTLGFTKEELCARPYCEFIHPEDRAKRCKKQKRSNKGTAVVCCEDRYLCKDGSYKWLSWTDYTDINTGLIFAVARDITGQKKAEEALQKARDELELRVQERTAELSKANEKMVAEIDERKKIARALQESEERYRILFEESPISLWEKDFSEIKKRIDQLKASGIRNFRKYFRENPDVVHHYAGLMKVVDANKTVVDLYKAKSREQFLTDIGKVFHDETYELFKGELLAIAEGRLIHESEGITQKFTGEKNHIAIKWAVPQGYVDTFSKVLVSVMDITERKKSEKALLESERKYKRLSQEFDTLLNANPDNLLLLSPDLKILWSNKASATSFGREASELTELNYFSFYKNVLSPGKNYPSIKSFRTGKEETDEITTLDGRILDLRAFPLKDDLGNVKSVMELARDITDKVRMEKETSSMQLKLIHANKMTALGTLVSGIAHEINNPNSFIMSNAGMLSDMWKELNELMTRYSSDRCCNPAGKSSFAEMNEAVPRLLQGISDGSQRIRRIVDNLRDLSRPGRSGMDETVDVNKLIMISRTILGNQIKNCTDNFNIHCRRTIPGVKGNSQQIEQVIINILMNSLQALPNRNCGIWVSTSFRKKSGSVIIRVRDEGIGMSGDIYERIKEPFFTTKFDSGGTGLGLSISYDIIKGHKGSLEFESRPGEGTTAIVTLPAYDKQVDL